jgi:hypothetical protein
MLMQLPMMQSELLQLQHRMPPFGANANSLTHFPMLPAPVGAPPTHGFVIPGQPGLWTRAPPFP